MISEHEFQSEWRKLFAATGVTEETIRAARRLVDKLSLESPLRVRFDKELDDMEALADRDVG